MSQANRGEYTQLPGGREPIRPPSLPIPEAFGLSAELAWLKIQGEYMNLAEYPGILKIEVSQPPEQWEIELHAQHGQEIDGLPPYVVRFTYNGWPAGAVDANGGIVAGGEAANEKSLCEALRVAIRELQPESEMEE